MSVADPRLRDAQVREVLPRLLRGQLGELRLDLRRRRRPPRSRDASARSARTATTCGEASARRERVLGDVGGEEDRLGRQEEEAPRRPRAPPGRARASGRACRCSGARCSLSSDRRRSRAPPRRRPARSSPPCRATVRDGLEVRQDELRLDRLHVGDRVERSRRRARRPCPRNSARPRRSRPPRGCAGGTCFPRPSPFEAPRTRPAMSTNSMTRRNDRLRLHDPRERRRGARRAP